MKKTFLLFVLTLIQVSQMLSQWNIDPENPTIVCNEVCKQNNVEQVGDGDGGTFVFWLDSRTSCSSVTINKIYGQHYNSEGVALWEAGGREIINEIDNIWAFSMTESHSGDIMLTWFTTNSTYNNLVKAQRIDENGEKIWPTDLALLQADGCSGFYILGISNIQVLKTATLYAARINVTYCGGANGNRIARFDNSGNLIGPFNGEPEGNQSYNGTAGIDNTYDSSNDIYLFYTNGNGQGAHASAMRISAVGDTVFAPIDVLAGTNGLNYQFWALSDENGLAVCYQSNGDNGTSTDIFLRKLNPDGTWAWGGNIVTVCGANGNQGTFHITQDNDYYYVCWADGRPGVVSNYALYAQKINKSTGAIEWAQDGIEIQNQGSYLPVPKIQLNGDGSMIILHEASNPLYFNASLVLSDGTLGWNDPVTLHNSLPFYEDYSVINSDGNIITAWAQAASGGGADNIFIARLYDANTVNITEQISACDEYTSHGETFTSSGTYIQEQGDTVLTIELTINYSYATTLNETACFEYTFLGNTYTTSGLYTFPGLTTAGCDSTTTLNLTIEEVNTNITLLNSTLTAEATNSEYSWIDCSDNSTLGVFEQSFTPIENGSYAVNITQGECSATSACVDVLVNDISVSWSIETPSIFPNPGHESLNIILPENPGISEIFMYDGFGRLISSKRVSGSAMITEQTSELPSGLYLITISNGQEKWNLNWLKL